MRLSIEGSKLLLRREDPCFSHPLRGACRAAKLKPRIKMERELMSNANSWNTARPALYPLAPLPASALAGVRRRRTFAILLDLIFVSFLSFAIFFVLGVLTLGLAWLVLP